MHSERHHTMGQLSNLSNFEGYLQLFTWPKTWSSPHFLGSGDSAEIYPDWKRTWSKRPKILEGEAGAASSRFSRSKFPHFGGLRTTLSPPFWPIPSPIFWKKQLLKVKGFQRSVRPAILSRARLVRMLRPMWRICLDANPFTPKVAQSHHIHIVRYNGTSRHSHILKSIPVQTVGL